VGGEQINEIPGQTRIEELIEDQPSEEVPTPEAQEEPRQDDDGPSWQTWSGIGNRP